MYLIQYLCNWITPVVGYNKAYICPTTSANMFLLVTIPLNGFVSVMGKEMGKFKVYWFSVIGGQIKQ